MTIADPTDTRPRGYRLGPRETRGLLLSLRAGQLLLVATGLVALVAGLAAGPAVAVLGGLALALTLVTAFVPMAGRTAEQWLPSVAGYGLTRLGGANRQRHRPRPAARPTDPRLRLPGPLAGLVLHSAGVDGGRAVAVVHDRAGATLTAVAVVRGSTFALADASDKDRRVAAWGSMLAGLARDGSPIRRVAWLERTLPDPGDALERFWAEAGGHGTAAAIASYRSLIASAGPVTQTHETHLVVQVDTRRLRGTRRPGSGHTAGALGVLLRELAAIQDQLLRAGLDVAGWLPPRGLAALLRTSYEPRAHARVARRREGEGDGAGVDPAAAGPMATENGWAHYRSDDAWHATYWIAEWPRLPGRRRLPRSAAAADRLPAHHRGRRRTGGRAAGGAGGAGGADRGAGEREPAGAAGAAGQRPHPDRGRGRRGAGAELVAGHAAYRFTGYITVTGKSLEELEDGCAQIEHAAHRSRLEIRRLYGQQDEAFTFTLPLARGLP